jgi:hypothetical protein
LWVIDLLDAAECVNGQQVDYAYLPHGAELQIAGNTRARVYPQLASAAADACRNPPLRATTGTPPPHF